MEEADALFVGGAEETAIGGWFAGAMESGGVGGHYSSWGLLGSRAGAPDIADVTGLLRLKKTHQLRVSRSPSWSK